MIKENKPQTKKPRSADKLVSSTSAHKVVSLFKAPTSDFQSVAKPNPYKAPVTTPTGLYNLWRDAVSEFYPETYIAAPTAKVSVQCKHILQKSVGLIEADEWYKFIMNVMYKWSAGEMQSDFTQETGFKTTPTCLDVGVILMNLSYFITWYKKNYCDPGSFSVQSKTDTPFTHKKSLQNKHVSEKEVKLFDKKAVSTAGYTYLGGKKFNIHGDLMGTLEELVATARVTGEDSEAAMFYVRLQSQAVDIATSDLRISELIKQLQQT